jgi:hypothetical protein
VHLYEPVEAKCEKELALRQRGQCFEQRSWLDRRRAQQVVDFTAHIFDGSTVAQMRTNELMHARRHGIKPKLRSDLRSYPGIKELVVFPESDDSGAQNGDKRTFVQEALNLAPEITRRDATRRGRKGDRCGGIHCAVCKQSRWRCARSKDTSFAKFPRPIAKDRNFRSTATLRMCTDASLTNLLRDCQVDCRSG